MMIADENELVLIRKPITKIKAVGQIRLQP